MVGEDAGLVPPVGGGGGGGGAMVGEGVEVVPLAPPGRH